MKEFNNIKGKRFVLAMKDGWNSEDYIIDRKWFDKLLEIKLELEAAGISLAISF